ncbi:hypothetical protein ElyMa_005198800 [Elysia marginata]|uniref:Uncharacterized protein n=1 Tax=Elysia marginata TaxID=1093978 RepID=A0AAV4JT70_9GAST|nr:hypothetical protein ElyMa_005198800 [Elysia marginata]
MLIALRQARQVEGRKQRQILRYWLQRQSTCFLQQVKAAHIPSRRTQLSTLRVVVTALPLLTNPPLPVTLMFTEKKEAWTLCVPS